MKNQHETQNSGNWPQCCGQPMAYFRSTTEEIPSHFYCIKCGKEIPDKQTTDSKVDMELL